MRNFGHNGQEDFFGIGINGKSSELHAAMGLCIFPAIDKIIERRKTISEFYDNHLNNFAIITKPILRADVTHHNFSYYPILFNSEGELLLIKKRLEIEGINCRRYFFPSLNTLNYVENNLEHSISESVSKRILCLPIYPDLTIADVERICSLILQGND